MKNLVFRSNTFLDLFNLSYSKLISQVIFIYGILSISDQNLTIPHLFSLFLLYLLLIFSLCPGPNETMQYENNNYATMKIKYSLCITQLKSFIC